MKNEPAEARYLPQIVEDYKGNPDCFGISNLLIPTLTLSRGSHGRYAKAISPKILLRLIMR